MNHVVEAAHRGGDGMWFPTQEQDSQHSRMDGEGLTRNQWLLMAADGEESSFFRGVSIPQWRAPHRCAHGSTNWAQWDIE